MAIKTTVRMGGDSGATTVDYSAEIPIFDEDGNFLFSAGMKCDNGNASQFEFTIINDLGDIPRANLTKNLPAFTRVTVTENGPGYEAALAYGRIASKHIDRGDHPWADSRTFRVKVNDANFDLTDLDLVAPWVRGAESGRARVLAALSAFCNGSPRLTTVIANHLVAAGGEVTMPAHTYPAGTSLIEILNDCATVEGKFYAVVIHHDAGASHLCFQYQDEDDHTNFLSTLTITDNNPNLTTQFPPIWDQGAAAIEEGDTDPISHLVSKYGTGEDSYYVAANASRVTSYDYRARAYNDSKSETAAQAATRAEAVLAAKGREHVSHQVTIQLRASQVDLLCAGMSIQIRSAASMGGQYLGTTQTRRIAELKWEPIAPDVGVVPGFYLAHMQLDRAVRVLPEGKGAPVGPKAPTSGTSATTLYNLDFEEVATDDFRETVAIYPSGTGLWPQGQANTSAATGGGDNPGDALGNGTGYAFFGSSFGAAHSPSLPATPGIVYRWACYARANASPQTDVLTVKFYDAANVLLSTGTLASIASTNVWEQYTADFTAPSGAAYQIMWGEVAPLTAAFYDKVVVSIPGTAADSTVPTDGTGTGSVGDDTDTFAPIDHSHDHANITTGGPYHMAEDVTFSPTGTIAATTVQAAIAEVASEASGVTDHGALTGLADDDHPQYATNAELTAHEGTTHGGVTEAEVRDAGRWETVTNGSVASPECVYEAGDIVIEWVTGP